MWVPSVQVELSDTFPVQLPSVGFRRDLRQMKVEEVEGKWSSSEGGMSSGV